MIKEKIDAILKKILISILIITILMPSTYSLAVTVTTSTVKSTGNTSVIKDNTKNENLLKDKDETSKEIMIENAWNDYAAKAITEYKGVYDSWKQSGGMTKWYGATEEGIYTGVGTKMSSGYINDIITIYDDKTYKANEDLVMSALNAASGNMPLIKGKTIEIVDSKVDPNAKNYQALYKAAVDAAVGQVIKSVTDPVFTQIGYGLDNSVPVLGSFVADMAKKYALKGTGWEQKLKDSISTSIGIKVDDNINKNVKPNIDWGYEAMDSAFNAMGSYTTKVTNDVITEAFDKLFDKLGAKLGSNSIQQALANVATSFLKPYIDKAFNTAKEGYMDSRYGASETKKYISKQTDGKASIDDIKKHIMENTKISDDCKNAQIRALEASGKKELTSDEYQKALDEVGKKDSGIKELEKANQDALKANEKDCMEAAETMVNSSKEGIDKKITQLKIQNEAKLRIS